MLKTCVIRYVCRKESDVISRGGKCMVMIDCNAVIYLPDGTFRPKNYSILIHQVIIT